MVCALGLRDDLVHVLLNDIWYVGRKVCGVIYALMAVAWFKGRFSTATQRERTYTLRYYGSYQHGKRYLCKQKPYQS